MPIVFIGKSIILLNFCKGQLVTEAFEAKLRLLLNCQLCQQMSLEHVRSNFKVSVYHLQSRALCGLHDLYVIFHDFYVIHHDG